jgi:DNA primase
MQVYNDGYHCFSCGAHGDVIDLAAQLYGVDSREAIRITAELAGISAVSDTKEYAERARKARMEATQRNTTIEALKHSYDKLLAEFVRLERNKTEYAPRSPDETDLHPLFREALTRLDYVGYALQQCEWAIIDAERK